MAERTRATESPQPTGGGGPGRSTEPSGDSSRASGSKAADDTATDASSASRPASDHSPDAPDNTDQLSAGADGTDPDTSGGGDQEDALDQSPGDTPGEAEAGPAPASDSAARRNASATAGNRTDSRPARSESSEIRSGHKVTRRYRLEECITRRDGFSSWRAVDEKLRRAVGVHLLPDDHERAPEVLSAARSAALLGDPRFVQVLDADEHRGLVYVIHEWLPDATPLRTLFASGPLSPYDSAALVSQLAESLATAHHAGLAHLRLNPATVLQTDAGPFRIRGLAVDAALRGITHDHPARADTEAIGALLYAAQTQRWPYAKGAHGLRGMAELGWSSRAALATPEQVRAGVHRDLSDLAMRALTNDGATAASETPPCVTPAELAEAAAQLPRIPPPDPASEPVPGCLRTSYQQGTHHLGHASGGPAGAASTSAPPALPGRTGAAVKWAVSALLIVALGLGSWQIADALIGGDGSSSPDPSPSAPPPAAEDDEAPPPAAEGALSIAEVIDFDPYGPSGSQNPEAAPYAVDGDPETSWHTRNYFSADLGNLKPGVGLVLDLGEVQEVSSVSVDLIGETTVELLAAPPTVDEGAPDAYGSFEHVAEDVGSSLTFTADDPFETRYVLVWLTHLPAGEDGNYRGRVSNVEVSG